MTVSPNSNYQSQFMLNFSRVSKSLSDSEYVGSSEQSTKQVLDSGIRPGARFVPI